MRRLFVCCVGLVVLIAASCDDGKVNSTTVAPGEEKQLRELAAKYPDSLLLKENLVQYYRDIDNYDQAIKETEIILQKDSMNARVLNMQATLFFENGDTAKAIHAFEKAIYINPLPASIASLGSLYAQTKNPLALSLADALQDAPFAKAKQQALFIKGLYYSYIGDKAKAISYFDECLALDYRDVFFIQGKSNLFIQPWQIFASIKRIEKGDRNTKNI